MRGAVLIALLLGACSSTPNVSDKWTHPEKDSMEARADIADCQRFFGSNDAQIARCMQGKGWKPAKKASKGFFGLF